MGLANDHRFLNYGTIPKAYWGCICDFCPSFCGTLKFAEVGVDRQSHTGLVLFVLCTPYSRS